MTLLLRPRAAPVKKGRKAVRAIVDAAPTGKRTLAWWQRWLAANWNAPSP